MSKLLSVKDLHLRMAEAEGAKASAALKAREAEEKEKKWRVRRCHHRLQRFFFFFFFPVVQHSVRKNLSGLPKEIYHYWKRKLRPLGYHIRYHIVDYPGGMPGDIAITLSWG